MIISELIRVFKKIRLSYLVKTVNGKRNLFFYEHILTKRVCVYPSHGEIRPKWWNLKEQSMTCGLDLKTWKNILIFMIV